MAFLLVFGLVGGWLLAGRMLAPLDRITDATRIAATGSLSHRIRLPGRSDEFRELADGFDVWVTTSVHPRSVVVTVENTGETLTPQLISTLGEPFQRGTRRVRTDHAGVGLGLAIVKASPEHTTEPSLSPPERLGGCPPRRSYPPRPRALGLEHVSPGATRLMVN
jgi:nitrogen fixation/metabolism regulation signal transduction histidine kinase